MTALGKQDMGRPLGVRINSQGRHLFYAKRSWCSLSSEQKEYAVSGNHHMPPGFTLHYSPLLPFPQLWEWKEFIFIVVITFFKKYILNWFLERNIERETLMRKNHQLLPVLLQDINPTTWTSALGPRVAQPLSHTDLKCSYRGEAEFLLLCCKAGLFAWITMRVKILDKKESLSNGDQDS